MFFFQKITFGTQRMNQEMYDSLFELVIQLEDDGCVSSTVEAVALLKDASYAAVLQHLGIEIKGKWNKKR